MMLRQGVDILVATPGRLIDHIWRANIDFRHTEYLVLDEADRMLDMGFIKDVSEIVQLIPTQRQSMLFSATLEQEIQRLAKDILRDPVRIEVAPPSTTLDEVDQFIVRTSRGQKRSKLGELIQAHGMNRTIIFARTKVGASRLAGGLRDRGHKASAIHSDRSQDERTRTLEQFREGRIHFLVATDIAARGLDIDDVSHVVNYDLPYAAKDYVHRIGRTARAGRRGMALSLVTPEDVRGIQAIERLISRKLSWLGEGESPSVTDSMPAHSAGRQRRRTRSGNEAGRRANGNARRRPVAGQESGQRRRSRRASVTRSEREHRVDAPARGNGRRPVGIPRKIIDGLRRGLFWGRR
jgi:ATP-dependent RNA helicase RhlE